MKNEENKEYTNNLEASIETMEPLQYRVVVHNDDFTPMEFVVGILEKFFFMDRQRAAQIMMEAHTNGTAACGIFSKDYAESKIAQVIEFAQNHEHPFYCSMEVA